MSENTEIQELQRRLDDLHESSSRLKTRIDELIIERDKLIQKYKNMEDWNKWMIQEIGQVHEIARQLSADLGAIRKVCQLEGMVVTIGDKSLEEYNKIINNE